MKKDIIFGFVVFTSFLIQASDGSFNILKDAFYRKIITEAAMSNGIMNSITQDEFRNAKIQAIQHVYTDMYHRDPKLASSEKETIKRVGRQVFADIEKKLPAHLDRIANMDLTYASGSEGMPPAKEKPLYSGSDKSAFSRVVRGEKQFGKFKQIVSE